MQRWLRSESDSDAAQPGIAADGPSRRRARLVAEPASPGAEQARDPPPAAGRAEQFEVWIQFDRARAEGRARAFLSEAL